MSADPTTPAPRMDRHELYERAVQSPAMQARFLRALLGHDRAGIVTLGEDFSAAGAIARAFLAQCPDHRAVCVDLDAQALSRLVEMLDPALRPNLTVRNADVFDASDSADIIAALNFSLCEIHDRAGLVRYCRKALRRLNPGGILVADLYGGADAMAAGESEELLPGGVRYTWEQREANPLTGRVVNAMHFDLPGGVHMRDAFVYDWRLWGVPELRDAMLEAGFASTEVHDRLGGAIDTDGALHPLPVEDPDELDDTFVVSIVARAGETA
ncbi:MAG: class I SAM-dependent methyltransferase [Phycisphaeraceae bacterium]|nr:class I SAM-dependent methyltransferase [Phycisphaeraceae bacterium]